MPTFRCQVAAKTNPSGRKLGPDQHSPSAMGFVLENNEEYSEFHRDSGYQGKDEAGVLRRSHARVVHETVPATAELCKEIVAAVKEKYGVAQVSFRQMMDETVGGADAAARGPGRPSKGEVAAKKHAAELTEANAEAQGRIKDLEAMLAAERKKS